MKIKIVVNYLISVFLSAIFLVGCSKKDSIIQPSEQKNAAVIDLNITHQLIQGFGGANIVPWRPAMTEAEMDKAFGRGKDQLGFSILRIRVPYQESEFALNIPIAKMAIERGAKVIASPWTPPAWMKTNNNIVGGRLNDTSYNSYATHLKSFVDYMASNDAPLYAVSIQNEPDISVTYESCDWNASQMLKFVKENAPSVGASIIAPESYNFNKTISDAILNDSVAVKNIHIIGGHLYGGGLARYPLAESKGKEVWMTEYLDLDTSWPANLSTGKQINDCMNAGMSAYIWWYIVRFYGPIYDDGSHPSTPPGAVQGEISKRGYVMSQFARFIRPGYYRVYATTNPQPNIDITAYKNGSKVVIVAINRNSSSINQSFVLQNGNASKFTPYVTTITKNCSQENAMMVINNIFTFNLEASSITTFVSD